jgi:hypothetical protein
MANTEINFSTETIPVENVDAALAALGIRQEDLKNISEVHISPREVTIHAFARNDGGGVQVATTPYGNIAVMGIHTYKIDKNHVDGE